MFRFIAQCSYHFSLFFFLRLFYDFVSLSRRKISKYQKNNITTQVRIPIFSCYDNFNGLPFYVRLKVAIKIVMLHASPCRTHMLPANHWFLFLILFRHNTDYSGVWLLVTSDFVTYATFSQISVSMSNRRTTQTYLHMFRRVHLQLQATATQYT